MFSIHFCNSCNTSFPSPIVDTKKIYEFIYQNGEHVPGYDRYWRYFKAIKNQEKPLQFLAKSEEAYWGIQRTLSTLTKDKNEIKILEIGSGLGYLTYALRSNGYNAVGIDISKEAVDQSKKNFGDYYLHDDLFNYSKNNSEQYNIIILTEVIEHVENPLEFIEAALNLLSIGGKILMTTPNKSIMPTDIFWETESPPVHQWWFSEDSMRYIANLYNLKIDFVDFTDFYKMKPKLIRLKRIRRKQMRSPILNVNGELINRSNAPKKDAFKSFYKKVKIMFLKLKANFNSDVIVCNERGETMCIIFEK